MNATLKEKEQKEYEMGLARAALGALKRKRQDVCGDVGVGVGGEGESSTEQSEVDRDVAKFESLKWKDEMVILTKRRKIEKSREEEIIKKKEAALVEEMNAGDSEAEDNGGGWGDKTEDMEIEDPLRGLGEEVAKRKVDDVQTPHNILHHSVGQIICYISFAFSH